MMYWIGAGAVVGMLMGGGNAGKASGLASGGLEGLLPARCDCNITQHLNAAAGDMLCLQMVHAIASEKHWVVSKSPRQMPISGKIGRLAGVSMQTGCITIRVATQKTMSAHTKEGGTPTNHQMAFTKWHK